MNEVTGNTMLADLIREHAYSGGDATAEDLAQAIADEFGPAMMLDFDPSLEDVVIMKASIRQVRDENGSIRTLEDEDVDREIDKQIKMWSEYVIKLILLKRIREREATSPSWWRKALRGVGIVEE